MRFDTEKIERIKTGMVRFNQCVLTFPVWLTVGVSGLFRNKDGTSGWKKSEKNNRFDKMY